MQNSNCTVVILKKQALIINLATVTVGFFRLRIFSLQFFLLQGNNYQVHSGQVAVRYCSCLCNKPSVHCRHATQTSNLKQNFRINVAQLTISMHGILSHIIQGLTYSFECLTELSVYFYSISKKIFKILQYTSSNNTFKLFNNLFFCSQFIHSFLPSFLLIQIVYLSSVLLTISLDCIGVVS